MVCLLQDKRRSIKKLLCSTNEDNSTETVTDENLVKEICFQVNNGDGKAKVRVLLSFIYYLWKRKSRLLIVVPGDVIGKELRYQRTASMRLTE